MHAKLKAFLNDVWFDTNIISMVRDLEVFFLNAKEMDLKLEVALEIVKRGFFHFYPHAPQGIFLKKHLRFIIENSQNKTIKDFCSQLLKIHSKSYQSEINYLFLAHCYNLLVLESIAQHGIISSATAHEYGFCLRSNDSGTNQMVHLNAIILKPNQKKKQIKLLNVSDKEKRDQGLDKTLDYLIEDKFTGFYSIAMERSYEPSTSSNRKTAVENQHATRCERILNSVVFIFNHPDLATHYTYDDLPYFEVISKGCCVDYIQAILSPPHLVSYLKLLFSSKTVIELEIQSMTRIPDFCKGIRSYIDQYMPERFMVHLTRLATNSDMKILLSTEHFRSETMNRQAREALWNKKNAEEETLLAIETAKNSLIECGIKDQGIANLILSYYRVKFSGVQEFKLTTSEQNCIKLDSINASM